jgi:hypothetical protein
MIVVDNDVLIEIFDACLCLFFYSRRVLFGFEGIW